MLTKNKSIKSKDFVEFLEQVARNKIGKLTLLVDSVGVHRTEEVQRAAERLSIELLFGAPYSSEFAPIERLWKHAKHRWRKLMLSRTDWKHEARLHGLIRHCCLNVNRKWMSQYWKTCNSRMTDWLRTPG